MYFWLTICIILNLFSEHCHFSAYGWNRTNCHYFLFFKSQPLKHPVLCNGKNFWSWIKFSSFLSSWSFLWADYLQETIEYLLLFSPFHNLLFHLISLNPTPSKLRKGVPLREELSVREKARQVEKLIFGFFYVSQNTSWFFSINSVSQFSHSVVSDSLRLHESQHARPPCSSQSPGVHSDSCPSSPWCHPAISSSVVPFSYCPQSLPASESFLMTQLFAWGGQSTGVSASASFPPKKSQSWSPSEWTGWISLQSKGLSRVFSNTTVQKHQFFSA